MDTHAEQILQSALDLHPSDRAAIAESLIQSLDEETQQDIETAWAEEIKRRLESIDKGEVQLVPWDEALSSMRQRLNG